MDATNKQLAFVILIGGKSARFGSDKGVFEFQGKPLLLYQLEVLYQFENYFFIIAHSQAQINSYLEKIVFHRYSNVSFILDDRDLISDDKIRSPMIGLYTAFKELDKRGFKRAFTLSCDMPLIKADVVKFLIEQSTSYDCCIPKWRNGFLEPLFAIYPVRKALDKAKLNLEQQKFKMTNLLDESWNINYISIEDLIYTLDENYLTFTNINGPVDLEKLMKLLKED